MDDFSIFWTGKYYQNWENKSHSHIFYQMVSSRKGNCIIEIGDKTYTTEPRQVFVIPPETPHSIHTLPDSAAPQLMDIKFSVANEDYRRELAMLPTCIEASDSSRFLYYFESIMRESEQQHSHYYQRISWYFGILLTDLIRESLGGRSEEAPAISAGEDESTYNGIDMGALLRYIEQHCDSAISLDDLASEAKVSKTTLIHAFRQSYDTTPIRYINAVRTSRAKRLLETTDMSVSEISELIGFQSIHYFSRYFKSKEGVSPSEYRTLYARSHFYSYGGSPDSHHNGESRGLPDGLAEELSSGDHFHTLVPETVRAFEDMSKENEE